MNSKEVIVNVLNKPLYNDIINIILEYSLCTICKNNVSENRYICMKCIIHNAHKNINYNPRKFL